MSRFAFPKITYNYAGAQVGSHGIAADDLESLGPALEVARAEVLADFELWKSGKPAPAEKQPLDAAFIGLPEQLLNEYELRRERSQVGRIIARAKQLAESVDRVVVLGIGGSYMGARALMESCCHPFYNELSRGERGSYPRLYFEGNNVDNDASQGLLDLLGHRAATGIQDRWGIVVISKSGGTLETAVAFRQFLSALRASSNHDADRVASLVVPVTGESGKLFELSRALGCKEIFPIPDGVGGRFSIFTAVGLLPAALLGLNVKALLEGAAAMNAQFKSQPRGQNVVLDYVGVCHLMEERHGCRTRILSTWGKGLEAAGLWHDQLLSESLGKQERGALPLTVVNTRDLHSRGQQHQEGRRDKLITNVIVDRVKRDRLLVGESEFNQDNLNQIADKTLADIMTAAIDGTNQAYRDAERPTTDLHLPTLDEASLGQFFQMLMLATVVEGRLIGVNPYGQPGVEAYKKNMQRNLGMR